MAMDPSWDIDPSWERRKEHRLAVPATAVLFLEGVELGQFAVDNLSTSGGLFTGDIGLSRGDSISVLLTVPGHHPVDVDATVMRASRIGVSVKLGVRFEHWSSSTEDMLRELLLGTSDGLPETPPTLPELWEMDDPDLIEVVPMPP